MTTTHRFIAPGIRLATLIALFAGIFIVTPVQAQFNARADAADRFEALDVPVVPVLNVSPAWRVHASQQFTASLESPIESVRQQTLQNIIILATLHDDELDLSDVAPALLDVYRFDKNESLRIMALSALMAVGEPHSIQRLREVAPSVRSERLRRHTVLALAQYPAGSSQ